MNLFANTATVVNPPACIYFRLNTSECFTLGDVTTVNMTMVKGGVAYNVIPAEMDVSFDLRIPPTVNLQVCRPADSSCSADLLASRPPASKVTLGLEPTLTPLSFLTLARSLNGRSKSGAKKQGRTSLMNLLRCVNVAPLETLFLLWLEAERAAVHCRNI